MADYRVFLIEDACAKLSWRIEHCHVLVGDRIQLGLHGLFTKVANDSWSVRAVLSGLAKA